jgi:hypothetical protein
MAIFLGLGSYKGIENISHYGRLIVTNIDPWPEWAKQQRPTYAGLKSFYDINILKLCKHPITYEDIRHSYPLLLYQNFWTAICNKCRLTVRYLKYGIYILGLLPTLLFFIGSLRILFSLKSVLCCSNANEPPLNKALYEAVSLFLLLSGLLMIAFFGAKYDIYSIFQSRFLFPSLLSILILFSSGLDYVRKKWVVAQKIVYPLLMCLYLLSALFFIVRLDQLRPLVEFTDRVLATIFPP